MKTIWEVEDKEKRVFLDNYEDECGELFLLSNGNDSLLVFHTDCGEFRVICDKANNFNMGEELFTSEFDGYMISPVEVEITIKDIPKKGKKK